MAFIEKNVVHDCPLYENLTHTYAHTGTHKHTQIHTHDDNTQSLGEVMKDDMVRAVMRRCRPPCHAITLPIFGLLQLWCPPNYA